ncbi:phage tail spike protein [uncultured Clostridium sp.]|uniref:phage tail spike protein n=1 Tax=uncultured Clostridium sp. TaxID=59620 RepID=UPI00260E51DC|nr:phage tail spike protein [uncultured Clostridium sp.]
MITLFKANEINFQNDGIEVLDDIAISSYTTWKENGKWINESKFKNDFDKAENIKEGLILKLPTEKGDQLFRILKITKKNKKYVIAKGQHIGFDFENNFIQDINIVKKSGRAAIKQIQGGTVFNSKYNLSSNIDTVASARMVRKNGITALMGSDDNCFINRWGGYLILDNFNISINTSVGQDRGVEVLIGKNLTDMEGSIDISSVVTGINAMGYDGLTLPEGIYYSPLVSNYPEPRIKEFKFDNIKYKYSENNSSKEGYETLEEVYAAIRVECDKLFNESNIDKPTCNLRLNVIDLTKTDQYKGIELNERIFQGDIITANLEEYGFNVKLKMTANKYNNIKDCYEDFDLGDLKSNVFSTIDKVQIAVDKVVEQLGGNNWQDILDKSIKEATELIEAGIKDSYVVARKNEILIMDSPQVESSINVIRMNKNGLAFSQTGYNGPYTLAITIDGKINASCITTGELNAVLIKTGILMSSNSKTWLNMDDGTFSFADGKLKWLNDILSISGNLKQINSTTNKTSCEIKDNSFIVYDHSEVNSDSHEVGRLRAYRTQNKTDKKARNAIALNSRYDDLLIIGYLNEVGQLHEVMVFDSTGEYDGVSNVSINGAVKTYRLYFQNNEDTFSGDILGDENMLRFRTSLNEGGKFVFGHAGSLTENVMEISKEQIYHTGNIKCGNNMSCKNFIATGTKNRLVKTEDYGNRALNAYETAACYFGDIGEGQTDINCETIVKIDDVFLQKVNTDENYHVFLSKYDEGDIWVEEKNKDTFKVKSTFPYMKFSYEIKAKQKNYENERLKEINLSESEVDNAYKNN